MAEKKHRGRRTDAPDEVKARKAAEEEEEEYTPPAGRFHGRDYRKPKNTKDTLLRLAKYAINNKLLLALVLVMVLVSTFGMLYATYLLKPILDDCILPFLRGEIFDFSKLAITLAGLSLIYLVSAAATYGQSLVMVNIANNISNKLRKDLFEKLEKLPLGYFDSHTHGELMSRFTNDSDNVQMLFENSLIQFVMSIFSFVSTIIIMIVLSPRLFLITLAAILLISYITKVFGGRSRTLFKKQQSSLGKLNGFIEEMVEGTKVVKAFNYEEQARAQFNGLDSDYRNNATNAMFLGSLLMPIGTQIMNICYAVTAAVGGIFAISSGFTIGSLGVYLTYLKHAGQPIQNISNQVVQLLSAVAGAERIFAVIDTDSEEDNGVITLVPAREAEDGTLTEADSRTSVWAWKVPRDDRHAKLDMRAMGMNAELIHHAGLDYETPHKELLAARETYAQLLQKYAEYKGQFDLLKVKGDVRLINVDFSYVQGKPVLRDVSVYAKPGQKIAFVGSTGAGKTTITNLLNRFYDVDSGAITYDSIDIRDIKKDDLRHSFCMVLQDTHLFSATIMDNIRYGRLEATDEECIAAAKSANAHSFIIRLPQGYQTEITADGGNLSQGQRQLLAIARAAVANPPVMILDEATSSIDTRTEKLIEKGLDTLMEGRTVFIIAHRLSTVRNSKAIAVIENGEIIEKGNHEELLALQGRYYMLYTGQTQLT